MKYSKIIVCFVLLLGLSPIVRADITDVSVSPTVLDVNINTGMTQTLDWTVTLNRRNANSHQGDFFRTTSFFPLESVSQLITVVAPTSSTPQPVVVSESLTITPAQAQSWWSMNIRQLRYSRAFEDGAESAPSAFVTINLVDGNQATTQPGLSRFRVQATTLQINRIDLSFTDDTRVRFTEQNKRLQAKLEISYQGTGVLRGVWQLADASNVIGDPLFRNLSLVNEQLSALQQAEILSPNLPTERTGRFYVRFCATRIDQVGLQENSDTSCPSEIISTTIGYQIFPERKNIPLIQGVNPSTPAISSETLFNWPKVPKTDVYQLQILAKRKDNQTDSSHFPENNEFTLVRGMILPPSNNETFLSDFVLNSLKQDRTYYWRVSSFDSRGLLIAQSKLLPIYIN
jgi:hypothetical protein